MRKLKRKIKHIKEKSEQKPLIKKRYKKQKCAFVDENEKRCWRNAVGKSTLCKKHGGNPIVRENLIKKEEMDYAPSTTKFDPEIHPLKFIDYSRSGLSDVEIAAEFGVGISALREWAEKYEMFATAYEIGQALHESWWLQQGKSGLRDRSFNTSLFKFLTGNKLGYSDKIESKSMNMHVHGVLLAPDPKTEEEWAEEDVIDVDP